MTEIYLLYDLCSVMTNTFMSLFYCLFLSLEIEGILKSNQK